MPDNNSRLVYSTDGGRVRVDRPTAPLPSAAARPSDPDDGFVRLRREKKGRGGKTVTVVSGLAGAEADLDRWLKQIKTHCGTGGTREGRLLVVQGDHRERVQTLLEAAALRVKLAGG